MNRYINMLFLVCAVSVGIFIGCKVRDNQLSSNSSSLENMAVHYLSALTLSQSAFAQGNGSSTPSMPKGEWRCKQTGVDVAGFLTRNSCAIGSVYIVPLIDTARQSASQYSSASDTIDNTRTYGFLVCCSVASN